MDQQGAKRLIEGTFNQPFDDARFRVFIRNLLSNIDETKAFDYRGQIIHDSFRQHITHYKRVGKYFDTDGNSLDVLIVYLRKGSSLERARTAQRNFVGRYLNGGRGGILRDAALAAFVAPGEEDWRFSYIRMEYNQEITDSGRIKVREELTPARRYSFLVGKNEPNHTAQQQIVPILQDDRHNPTISELEQAFTVEAVTKRFYTDYRNLFEKLTAELDRIVQQNDRVRGEFESKTIETANFAKKLLGQIVFLYFLQKKGWLGVGKDDQGNLKPWGTGPKNFLQRLFNREFVDYGNFFNDVLEPLFYEALATERPDDYYSRFNCKIPFLNGGLFEAIHDYNWREIDILLPNGLFQQIFETFDLYNFTVREDEPLEKEVAVDPEMLGKVFENLLPENLRKGKGTYYTPRPIVHYMCQESLINYLAGKCEDVVPKKDIEELVRRGESAVEHDAITVQKLAENEGYKGDYKTPKIPESICNNAQLLDDKLAEIKVCDPAVGSGAFPVGMMHEIVKARNVLSTYLENEEDRDTYTLKRHCIQESLYGVDIDPGAIDIAKLRLWLSLIVDEEDYETINPLPNLDYKIMQGNSLIEDFHGISLDHTDEEAGDLLGKDHEMERLIRDLHEKQSAFFNATHPGEKRRLKDAVEEAVLAVFHYRLEQVNKPYYDSLKRIEQTVQTIPESVREQYRKEEEEKLIKHFDFDPEAVESELREMTHGNKLRSFFPWRLYFADVFQKQGGFDVVIANPPYVGFQGHKEGKAYLINNFVSATGRFDLYLPFIEQAVKLGREGAIGCYICPTNFMKRSHGAKLREYLVQEVSIVSVVDFGDFQIFQDALNYTGIFLWRRGKTRSQSTIAYENGMVKDDRLVLKGFSYPQGKLSGDMWIFRDPPTEALVEKIRAGKVKKLGELASGISEGIVTGKNPVFLMSKEDAQQLGLEQEILRDCLRGNNIRRYLTEPVKFVIFYPYRLEQDRTSSLSEKELKERFPEAYRYLLSRKSDLAGRGYFNRSNKLWFELWNERDIQRLGSEKIVVPELAERNRFAIATSTEFYVDTVCGITLQADTKLNLRYVLGLLNSKLIEWFYKQTTVPKASGFYIYKTMFLKGIPIRTIAFSDPVDKVHHDRIVKLVETMLKLHRDLQFATSDERRTLLQHQIRTTDKQINQLVYGLYRLTDEEIRIIEEEHL